MRKTLIHSEILETPKAPLDQTTTQLLTHAEAELTSEDPTHPIEDAFTSNTQGWRAAQPGPQTIRLRFHPPVPIQTIQLRFQEPQHQRSQEFSLHAEANGHRHEIVRQQFTFSPGGATEELETYTPNLTAVTILELRIDPDRSHNPADSRTYATLAALRLA